VEIFIMTAGQPGNVVQNVLLQRRRVMHFKFLFQASFILAREVWPVTRGPKLSRSRR
jgi:hypothetical protein